MQNKKGMTLMAVVLIVIVMGILLSFTVVSIDGIIDRTKAGTFASELKQVEYLVGEYKKKNNNKLNFAEVELNTSTLPTEFVTALSEENIVNGKIMLYKVNLIAIDAVNSLFGQKEFGEDDIYLVSATTGVVYYKQGYEYNGIMYYSVTGELKDILADQTEKIKGNEEEDKEEDKGEEQEVTDKKKVISKDTSYVGYFADIDGDGSVDGVIFADLCIGGSGEYGDSNGRYTIPKISDKTTVKDYYISQTSYTLTEATGYGTHPVLTATGSGKDRFYVMALTDIVGGVINSRSHSRGSVYLV